MYDRSTANLAVLMSALSRSSKSQAPQIVCIGGAVLDRKYKAKGVLAAGTSNPVSGMCSFGGVARNVAENLARLGVQVSFVSIVGDDETGRALIGHLGDLGVDVSHVAVSPSRPTAEYVAVLDPRNDLALGLADMDVFEELAAGMVAAALVDIGKAHWVFADCNLPAASLAALISRQADANFRLAIDAVSTPKVQRLPKNLTGVDLLFLNRDEAAALLGGAADFPAEQMASLLIERGTANAILTDGAGDLFIADGDRLSSFRPATAAPVDVTGAGDAMVAGTLYSLLAGEPLERAARVGALAATLTTESAASVRPDLSADFLKAAMPRIAN